MTLIAPSQSVLAQIPGMPAPATEEIVETGEPSPNDVRELARLLSDPKIVTWLEERAEPVEFEDAVAISISELIRENSEAIAERVHLVAEALATLPTTPGLLSQSWNDRFTGNERLALLNLMIIFLFTGIGLEWLYWRYAVRIKRWAHLRHKAELGTKALAVMLRLALIAAGVMIFIAAILGTFGLLEWHPAVEELVLACLFFIVGVRVAIAVTNAIYSPDDDLVRLVPVRRRSAGLLAYGFVGVAVLILAGSWISTSSQLLGARESAGLGIEIIAAALAAMLSSALFWVVHFRTDAQFRNVTVIIASAVTAVSIAVFVFWLVGATRVAGTIFTIAVLVYFGALLKRAIGLSFKPDDEADPDAQESQERLVGIYQPVAERLGRFAMIAIGIVIIAMIWDLEPWDISSSGSVLSQAVLILTDILVAWLIADLVWTMTRTAIDRKMAAMPKLTHGQTPGPEARMATLLPLFKKVVLVTVIVMVTLIALSSMGVNIAPIIAGAGVVGIAIGFGAQALVRDIVSGVFFLIDDAFRVGEYIEMGELRGTVESISIRSLRVRHHRGAVHTIPFGELKSLTNYSRDWVMMKLEFRVPFDTDLKLAKKIVKRIDAELQANPDYGHNFLEPLKFQGVRRMEEFNMVVGVKFMTKPGEQWTIRRDAYQRIRDEFDKAGIHFAQRNVKVEVIGSGELTDEVKEQAVGAAQDAIEQQAGVPAS